MKASLVEVEHVEVKNERRSIRKVAIQQHYKDTKNTAHRQTFPHFFFSRRGILGLSFFNGEVLGREVQYGSAVQLDGLRDDVVHNALLCVMMGQI